MQSRANTYPPRTSLSLARIRVSAKFQTIPWANFMHLPKFPRLLQLLYQTERHRNLRALFQLLKSQMKYSSRLNSEVYPTSSRPAWPSRRTNPIITSSFHLWRSTIHLAQPQKSTKLFLLMLQKMGSLLQLIGGSIGVRTELTWSHLMTIKLYLSLPT